MLMCYVYNQNIWANSSLQTGTSLPWKNKILPRRTGNWARPHLQWPVLPRGVYRVGVTLATWQQGSLRLKSKGLVQGYAASINSQMENHSQFQARRLFIRSSAWWPEEPMGICSLSLSPRPLIAYLEWLHKQAWDVCHWPGWLVSFPSHISAAAASITGAATWWWQHWGACSSQIHQHSLRPGSEHRHGHHSSAQQCYILGVRLCRLTRSALVQPFIRRAF
jgi:hypothetical protein